MEGTDDKWRTRLGGAAVLIFIWWGITYIPVVRDYAPGIASPVNTVSLTQADITSTGLTDEASGRIDDACHHIPFLLRPIMRMPTEVYVVAVKDGVEVQKVLVNCATGEEVGGSN